ncbi:hypothetical protein CP970_22110 [Streptomyces kanamyceticus]|uniref:Uncharacterized protein n=1 Tax=Streptomyces kanamyceticus TaxID=1967 RepID=A0A5J6GBQ8_STRKN|nr:hypothetical protein CP970_22110 [Streptomyces kanamyceticus]
MREELARMTEEQGTDGVLKVDSLDAYELPPGSMKYPPCQCPQHRAAPAQEAASDAHGGNAGEAGMAAVSSITP